MFIQDVPPEGGWLLSPGADAIPGTAAGQILDPDSPEGKVAQRIHDLGLCHKCGKRKGTTIWGDLFSINHGGGSFRCDVCVYSAQLEHALNRGIAIPKLTCSLMRAMMREWLQ